jgi:Tfp pilus assembly protein PilO
LEVVALLPRCLTLLLVQLHHVPSSQLTSLEFGSASSSESDTPSSCCNSLTLSPNLRLALKSFTPAMLISSLHRVARCSYSHSKRLVTTGRRSRDSEQFASLLQRRHLRLVALERRAVGVDVELAALALRFDAPERQLPQRSEFNWTCFFEEKHQKQQSASRSE